MKLIDDLRQRHLEEWEKHFHELRGDDKGVSRYYGAVVRAALAAGWFTDAPEPSAVDEMKPAEVRKLAKRVDDAYVGATTLDPNS